MKIAEPVCELIFEQTKHWIVIVLVSDLTVLSYLKKYCLSRSSKKYAKQNLHVESISYKSVVQEGLRL